MVSDLLVVDGYGAVGWAQQCQDAVAQGYMSAELKARTWHDLHAALQGVFVVTPPQFILDLDFNGTLDNAANAIKFLSTLEGYEQVTMIESPIRSMMWRATNRSGAHRSTPLPRTHGSRRS